PLRVSLGLNTWSTLNISSRKLKMFRKALRSRCGSDTSLGSGTLAKMSFRYAVAVGLKELVGTCVPVAWQVVPDHWIHTGLAKVPRRSVEVGTVAVGLL